MFPATVISHAVVGDDHRRFTIRTWYRASEKLSGWYWSAESEWSPIVIVSTEPCDGSERARDLAIATLTRITFA